LVMEDGQIVEQGTHRELLDARGHYFDLYNSQFTAAIEEPEEARGAVPVGAGPGAGPRPF
jgi:ATP-binding cassette, subfamily B, multidrug efflux pump